MDDDNYGLPALDPTTLGWLAGLLEGEGCFHAVRRSKGCCPYISLAMTDGDVVERVAKLWGRNVRRFRPPKPRKLVYSTSIGGVTALRWMLRLRNLFGRRRSLKVSQIINEWREAASNRVLKFRPEDREFVVAFLGTEGLDQLLLKREEKNSRKESERKRLYYQKNRAEVRSKAADFYTKNREARLAYARTYREKKKSEPPDARREYWRNYMRDYRHRLKHGLPIRRITRHPV